MYQINLLYSFSFSILKNMSSNPVLAFFDCTIQLPKFDFFLVKLSLNCYFFLLLFDVVLISI